MAVNKTSRADRQELVDLVLFTTYDWESVKMRHAIVDVLDSSLDLIHPWHTNLPSWRE